MDARIKSGHDDGEVEGGRIFSIVAKRDESLDEEIPSRRKYGFAVYPHP